MKFKILSIALSISLYANEMFAKTNNTEAPKVYYVSMINGKPIPRKPIKEYARNEATTKTMKLSIDASKKGQEIIGIGGAFNEIGGEALMSLPPKLQDEVMNNLFGKEEGNFAFCRTAVGASDFGFDAYSYSEVKDDYKMKKFSIEREKNSVIPYIQQAYKHNPDLQIFASPWSPPAWMKQSGFMDRGNEFKEKNTLIKEEKIYKAYALYFSKYIKAYAKEGIKLDRLVVQNETDVNSKYPTCYMKAEEMGDFITGYLKPQFKKDKIKTQIWAGSFRGINKDNATHAMDFVSNKDYMEAVSGVGIQYYNSYPIEDLFKEVPDLSLMHTEGVCFNGANAISQAYGRLAEVAKYLNKGVQNFCYWNMILNEESKSGWGWRQNSLIKIDRKNKKIIYNPDYAVMKLLSKFIPKGAVLLNNSSARDHITVLNDGHVALFVANREGGAKRYDITMNGKNHSVNVPAFSMSVIILDAKS